ncbi:MAG TPA: hypothetical protein VGR35_02425 [Tepidisphaeraceae bacterium]|nr:hypothetical protein [Tepidisphaeraceae bacterium]
MAKQNGPTQSSRQSRPSSPARSDGRQGESGGAQRPAASSSQPRSTGRNRATRGNRSAGGNRGSGSQKREQAQRRSQEQPSRGGALAGAGTKAVETVRENPIPAALIGAGLTWLIVKNRQRLPVPHVPEALSGLADTARESFGDAAQSTRQAVREGVGSAAESAKHGAATVAEYAQSGASKIGQAAKEGFQRSRDAVSDTWDTHPLAVGLGLLVAGVAAGMMLPAPRSDAITRAAKGLTRRVTLSGEELLESARRLVTTSARSASREARRQGLTPDQLGRKVKRVANAAAP